MVKGLELLLVTFVAVFAIKKIISNIETSKKLKGVFDVNYPKGILIFQNVMYIASAIVLMIGSSEVKIAKDPRYSILYIILLVMWMIDYFLAANPLVVKVDNILKIRIGDKKSKFGGIDFFNTWLGTYNEGIIVAGYFIEYKDIKVKQVSDEEIIILGKTKVKDENEKVEVRFLSKKSIEFMRNIIDNRINKSK